MSNHSVSIQWSNTGPDFLNRKYSREHQWLFDGGFVVPASPSPHIVPAPWSNAANVDPEEAYIASIASCHMLWFLHVACDAGYEVIAYEDQAVGEMTKNEQGVLWISRVSLHPKIQWHETTVPDEAIVEQLHELAHRNCFIANSVRTEIVVRS
jgi:organic hydroperoxide reductase OsmC/OhrA